MDRNPTEAPGPKIEPATHPNPLIERLYQAADHLWHNYVGRDLGRAATTLVDVNGEKHKSAVRHITVPPGQDPSHTEVLLTNRKNRDKAVIVMTVAGLMAAAGGVYLAYNRSQRKKLRRESLYKRKPRGGGKLPK